MSPCFYAVTGVWLLSMSLFGIAGLILRRQQVRNIPAWDFFSTFGSYFALWLALAFLVAAIAGTIGLIAGSCMVG